MVSRGCQISVARLRLLGKAERNSEYCRRMIGIAAPRGRPVLHPWFHWDLLVEASVEQVCNREKASSVEVAINW